jgi:hypothetical protein
MRESADQQREAKITRRTSKRRVQHLLHVQLLKAGQRALYECVPVAAAAVAARGGDNSVSSSDSMGICGYQTGTTDRLQHHAHITHSCL